jgi:4-amino-4-deoxy-L-arabinose transferase-like glycosyltransferase
MIKVFKKTGKLLLKNKYLIILIGIFASEIFFRFYQMDIKNPFGYDQVDNAWAAKNIIVNHGFPLVGMVAKGNSNIYIGPAYYYMIAVAYWIFNLNPIASAVMAGLTSIFTFWVIFYVAKKMFSMEVALFAVFINTFFLPAIMFDRVQWPVNFIPSISLLIFYVLYKITLGDVKKIIVLALLVGFSFSIHFTSIFYPVIIILALPFFPRNRETIKYILLAVPLFLLCLMPNIIYQLQQKSGGSNFTSYLHDYYHGFHLTRVKQLTGDALIQFNAYSFIDKLVPLKFIIVPLFFLAYLYKSVSREKLIFCYLILLWFIVPWFVFAMYSGEISDYYFSINRFIALLIVAYFFGRIWKIKNVIPKIAVIIVLIYIAFINVTAYLPYKDNSLAEREKDILQKIDRGEIIHLQVGVPDSYVYYYYMMQKGIDPYPVRK